MSKSGENCCYQSPADEDGNRAPCQFDATAKILVEVGGYTFCLHHLPYSENDLIEEYGSSNGENPNDYKESWDKERCKEFVADVHEELRAARKSDAPCNLTGTVFPAAFASSRKLLPGTSFVDCHFARGASFVDASFSDNVAKFTGAKFSGGPAVFFDLRTDGGSLYFEGAKFIDIDANFGTSGTPKNGTNENTYIIRVADFNGAEFSGEAKFINRKLRNRTSFEEVTFRKAPRFHGCEFHQDTTFPPIDNFKDTEDKNAAHAYRTLRLAMKQQEAHEEEAMFWALEQRSKRNNLDLKRPSKWLPWALSWAYQWLSAYGLSETRPLLWLGAWAAVIAPLIYFFLRNPIDQLAKPVGYSDILGFSLAQSVRPFFIWGDYDGSDIKSVLGEHIDPLSVKLFATADSLISLVLIALLILAVRRRFRMQ